MTEDLRKTLESYVAAWNRLDADGLASHWSAEEPGIHYVAEEVDMPLTRFDDVRRYWRRTAETIEWVKISVEDERYRLLTDDLAVVTYSMHVDASMRGYEAQGFEPVGSDVRVSAILRRIGDEWRFIHYVEAPLGALPFVRRVYNANARKRRS